MAGPIKIEINGVEMLNDNGVEWSMSFEEVLGNSSRATLRVQDRNSSWEPTDHWEVKATIRSNGWILWRGEIQSHGFELEPGVPWITWVLTCVDANDQLPQRLVGAFDGITWQDTSPGLGIFVNIDPYGVTLDTDKKTVKALFEHYVRIYGEEIDTTEYVYKHIDEIYPIEWSYSNVKSALEEMAALVQDNLQFWIDPDFKFHWRTIPAWQDLLQEAAAGGGGGALMFPELADDVPLAPYEIVDVDSDGVDTIGFSRLRMDFDGSTMPQQIYVKGGTGYVYNSDPLVGDTKTVVTEPTPGDAQRYELKFLEETKIWHKDDTGYVSVDFDLANASDTWHTVKWVFVAWNETRHKGGNYWKILEGPYQGKLVDDATNKLNGYGKIRVRKITEGGGGGSTVGVGGTGWTNEVTQDPNKRQAYLEAPISTTVARRNRLGGQAKYRAKYPTLRGSIEVYGLDGWRVGQAVKITDARLPAGLSGKYFMIQRVATSLLEATDLRRYRLDFGDGPRSRWSMRPDPGDITYPPPFAYIEVRAFDLTPGPDSSQRITGQFVANDGTPWEIKGKTVNWSVEAYNSAGVLQVGQGEVNPEVSVTNRHGRAYTTLTTGLATNLVYYVFADVKAE